MPKPSYLKASAAAADPLVGRFAWGGYATLGGELEFREENFDGLNWYHWAFSGLGSFLVEVAIK